MAGRDGFFTENRITVRVVLRQAALLSTTWRVVGAAEAPRPGANSKNSNGSSTTHRSTSTSSSTLSRAASARTMTSRPVRKMFMEVTQEAVLELQDAEEKSGQERRVPVAGTQQLAILATPPGLRDFDDEQLLRQKFPAERQRSDKGVSRSCWECDEDSDMHMDMVAIAAAPYTGTVDQLQPDRCTGEPSSGRKKAKTARHFSILKKTRRLVAAVSSERVSGHEDERGGDFEPLPVVGAGKEVARVDGGEVVSRGKGRNGNQETGLRVAHVRAMVSEHPVLPVPRRDVTPRLLCGKRGVHENLSQRVEPGVKIGA
eukprot:CAMPEP_0178989142 /NCGR_PEP_ID=MMETSP0795-20121207/4198_1 /TAXON_ID=88552 /ORGANISM="Amoebophrya sp., Strain Ameob2" /LENGTH=314 /DNA_ID=CAMNT_0020680487 /DNA_START=183 /DNA_END=1128 /DNA_ORIENTATION=+